MHVHAALNPVGEDVFFVQVLHTFNGRRILITIYITIYILFLLVVFKVCYSSVRTAFVWWREGLSQ